MVDISEMKKRIQAERKRREENTGKKVGGYPCPICDFTSDIEDITLKHIDDVHEGTFSRLESKYYGRPKAKITKVGTKLAYAGVKKTIQAEYAIEKKIYEAAIKSGKIVDEAQLKTMNVALAAINKAIETGEMLSEREKELEKKAREITKKAAPGALLKKAGEKIVEGGEKVEQKVKEKIVYPAKRLGKEGYTRLGEEGVSYLEMPVQQPEKKPTVFGRIKGAVSKVKLSAEKVVTPKSKEKEPSKEPSTKEKEKEEEKPEKDKEKKESELETKLKELTEKAKASPLEEHEWKELRRIEKQKEWLEKEEKERPTSKLGKAKKYGEQIKVGWEKFKGIPIIGGGAQQVTTAFQGAMWSGIFGFSLFLLFLFSTRWFIPMVEGYTGTPIMPQAVNLYILPFLTRAWYYLPIMVILATLPLAVVGGVTKVNLKGPSMACITIAAVEGSLILLNNYGLPLTETMFPEQSAFFRCMIKYSGNIQVCALNQTQEVQVDKADDLYQTITLEPGAITPSKSINPLNPNPNIDHPYYYPLTLFNKNRVGSPFEINVTKEGGIVVKVSDCETQKEGCVQEVPADEIISYPNKPISPGGYVIFQAKWNLATNLPPCKDYTYFHINITTEQSGGGSTKFGIIESNEGIDNQNFLYFFDPVVKTSSGPLDIYTYTIPFVQSINEGRNFTVYITVDNKGEGIAKIEKLYFYYNKDVFRDPNPLDQCYVYYTKLENRIDFQSWSCPPTENYCEFIFKPAIINKGEKFSIICDGYLKSTAFYGKSTNLISVTSNYDYTQTFTEQIACIAYTLEGSITCPKVCGPSQKCCCTCRKLDVPENWVTVTDSSCTDGCWILIGGMLTPTIVTWSPNACYCPPTTTSTTTSTTTTT